MAAKVPSLVDIYNPETGEKKRVHRVDAYDWINEHGWQLTPAAAPEPEEAPAPRQARARKLQAVLEEG